MRKFQLPAHGVALSLGCCGVMAIGAASPAALADESFLPAGSLIISSSTYDGNQGAVASLKVGSALPNTNTATIAAISDNNYVTVWNNDTVDGSFGVTSPIRLTAVEKAFIGKEATDAAFREAAAACAGSIDPTSDIHGSAEYRRDLARTLIYRALCDARDRCS